MTNENYDTRKSLGIIPLSGLQFSNLRRCTCNDVHTQGYVKAIELALAISLCPLRAVQL